MAVFNPLTQKIIVSALDSDKPKYAVPAPVTLALMLSAFGFASITIGTVAPGDARTLWYNKDTNKFRRYNPLTAAWADLIPSQWFMHTLQIAFRSAGVEGIMDDADKVPFFDVSADETKMISFADMKASLGVSGWVQYAANTLAVGAEAIEFDLPQSYNDIALIGTWSAERTNESNSSLNRPFLYGVYPTNATVQLGRDTGTVVIPGTTYKTRYLASGDRGDLTGFWWAQTIISNGQDTHVMYDVVNRVSRIRYTRDPGVNPENNAWRFTAGSVFKLFVR